MFKKFLLLITTIAIGVLFIGFAYSQNDPSTTDPSKIGNTADESKTEVKDDTVKSETVKSDTTGTEGTQTVSAAGAKSHTDGKTLFVNSKVLFKLTASDDFALEKIEYRVNDGAAATYENPFPLTVEGPHAIKYYGIDKMGNKEAEKSLSVVVDNTGPVIIIGTSAPVRKIGDKIYFPKNLLFSVTTADALSGVGRVEYTTDGTAYQDYAAPFSIPASGEVNLKVRATDNVNNVTEQFSFRVVDETGKEIEVKDLAAKLLVDDKAPVVTIKPDKELKQINSQNAASTDVKYFIEAKDDESGVAFTQYRLDGKGEFVTYTGEIQFLTNGRHQIDARAVDMTGNVSGISTLSVYVDIIPPKSDIETLDK